MYSSRSKYALASIAGIILGMLLFGVQSAFADTSNYFRSGAENPISISFTIYSDLNPPPETAEYIILYLFNGEAELVDVLAEPTIENAQNCTVVQNVSCFVPYVGEGNYNFVINGVIGSNVRIVGIAYTDENFDLITVESWLVNLVGLEENQENCDVELGDPCFNPIAGALIWGKSNTVATVSTSFSGILSIFVLVIGTIVIAIIALFGLGYGIRKIRQHITGDGFDSWQNAEKAHLEGHSMAVKETMKQFNK